MKEEQIPVEQTTLTQTVDEMSALFSRLANRMSYLEDIIVKITLCNLGHREMPEDLRMQVLDIGLGKLAELTDEEIVGALDVAMVEHLKVCTTCKDKISNDPKESVIKDKDLN